MGDGGEVREGLTSTGDGGEVGREADKFWQLLIPFLAGAS